MATTFPTIADLKAWLKIDDTVDDVALTEAVNAATAAQTAQLDLTDSDGVELAVLPDDVRQAWLLRAQRYLARRNSPEGLVGFGDFAPAQVARFDSDVRLLEGPWMNEPIVVA